MRRLHPIRLRESETPTPKGANVIDAKFEEVGRRTIWHRIMLATLAVFWAAVLGFAIPQIWMFSQRIGEFFAQR